MRTWSHRVIPACLAALGACGHSEPFAATDHDLDRPLIAGEPVQLTYGGGSGPAWLPDESQVVYAGRRLVGDSRDVCLNFLRAGGGTVQRQICNAGLADGGTVDSFASPTVAADQRLGFVHLSAPAGGPLVAAVYAASLAQPDSRVALRTIPFLGSDGAFYVEAWSPRWLGAGEIAFLGVAQEQHDPCAGCDPILVTYARTIFRAGMGALGTAAPVPGITFATSFTVGESGDVLYLTLPGDSRILRYVLSTGGSETVHDFGPAGIARDVHYAAGRLAAIVGGKVLVYPDDIGPLQTGDQGGHLYLVDTGTGEERRLSDDTQWYRHPALSPTGSALAAEGFAVSFVDPSDPFAPPGAVDTLIAGVGNIWVFGSP